MKHKSFMLLILTALLTLLLIGCTGTETQTKATRTCAKCGSQATTSFSGPSNILSEQGIPLSKCQRITGDIYSAPLCSTCAGKFRTMNPNY